MFDIEDFKDDLGSSRYKFQINRIQSESKETEAIESTVQKCINNLANQKKSFVIYGEPQSGKTEMMISLTAKLLDDDYKIIIVLLNDNLELLDQNITRFTKSSISPSPKKYSEVIDPEVTIGTNSWIIFCKKNSGDLQKLIDKIGNKPNKVIIDDEADYASPNAKINKDEKTKINELVEMLIGNNGSYIGVTATPARLDLNNTFDNETDHWVDFKPHSKYHGQDVFFQLNFEDKRPYHLVHLPDEGDKPSYLKTAFLNFIVSVSYLNTISPKEKHFSMLVHTSGKKDDHSKDQKNITSYFDTLYTKSDPGYKKLWNDLYESAKKKYPGHEEKIITYALRNINRYKIVLMNSETDRKNVNFSHGTTPISPFTVVIGGNIISRGVTFENLLIMFFTRDIKHKMQQDTYIQRARMFGTRHGYLEHFELHIPKNLFNNWHQCFVFHRLAIESIRTGNGAPAWLGDRKINPVASASMDKLNLNFDSGEMSFAIFDLDSKIKNIILSSESNFHKLDKIRDYLGEDYLPGHLLSFIKDGSKEFKEQSIIIHEPSTMMNYNSGGVDYANVSRQRGLLRPAINKIDYPPDTYHHLKIFYNDENKARFFYSYAGTVKFYRNVKNKAHYD